MNSSTCEQNAAEAGRTDRGVLCAKCEHLNAWGRSECTICGATLYMACSHCSHLNERVRTRCTNCQDPLHHSWLENARRRVSGGALKLSRVQVVVFCIGVALAFVLIFLLSRLHVPGPF
jgi:hypothetical protein